MVQVENLTSLYRPYQKKKIDLNDISKTDVDDYGNDESSDFLDKEECKKDEDWFINNNNLAWCLGDKYLQNIVLTKFRYLFSIIYLFPKLFSEICPFSEAFENSKNYKKTQKKISRLRFISF